MLVASNSKYFDAIVEHTIWIGESLNDISLLPQVIDKLFDLKSYGDVTSLKSSKTYSSLPLLILYFQAKKSYSIGSYSKAISISVEALEGLDLEVEIEKDLSKDIKDILISSYISLGKYDSAKRLIDKKTLQGQLYMAHIAMLNQQLGKAEQIIKRLLRIQKNGCE